MSIDVYAPAVQTAGNPSVWMQTAPYDPRRRSLGVSGIYTSFVGERNSNLRSTSGRTTGFSRSPADYQAGREEATDWHTSVTTESPLDASLPTVYATGDTEQASKYFEELRSRIHATNEVSRISEQRIKLLAVSHEQADASAEILARLEILDKRLLEKSPRVSRAQLVQLEKCVDELALLKEEQFDIASALNEFSLR